MLLEAPSDGSMKYKSKSDKYCNAKIACNSISFLSKNPCQVIRAYQQIEC
jgi:hypothetical protein